MTPSFERSTALQARLHEVVPGGAHTFAKGSDQYPEGMAPVLVRGRGARVWDVDGNEFVEYGMGMRAVTLGHGYEPVLEAVRAALVDGVSFTRPTELELAAAEDFLRVVPGADMVKFCKNASDATSAALRLARAATGREVVAMCRDQPYFASQDWFVGTLPISTGVPAAVRSLVRTFRYNDLASLRAVLEAEPVACVILEAASALAEPAPGFLEGVRALCDRHGTVLVFDETITGFRWAGGRRAVRVRRDAGPVDLGQGDGQRVLGRGAGGAARADGARRPAHGPPAGVPAVEHERRRDDGAGGVPRGRAGLHGPTLGPTRSRRWSGRAGRWPTGVNAAAAEAGIGEYLSVLGRPSCQIFRTADATGAPSQAMRTLFLQEILRRGVLGQSYVISAAHTDADVEQTVEAARAATVAYRKALETGRPEELFAGRPVAPAHRLMAEPRRLGARPARPARRPARQRTSGRAGRSGLFQHLRGDRRLGVRDAQVRGALVGHVQQAADPAGDGVLGHRRVGELTQLLQGRLRVLDPQTPGGQQVRRHVVAEDVEGARDPRRGGDGGAGRAAQVGVVEVGQPVRGGPDLAAHPPLLPGQHALVRAHPGEQGADGVAVADHHPVRAADLPRLRGDAEPAGRADQRQRRLRAGAGDLEGGAAARLGQRPVGEERAAPGGLGVAHPAGDDGRRQAAHRAAAGVEQARSAGPAPRRRGPPGSRSARCGAARPR